MGRFELVASYECLSSVEGWTSNARVKLTHPAIAELKRYWAELSNARAGRSWGPPEQTVVLWSDAATHAWGGHDQFGNVAGGQWTDAEFLLDTPQQEMLSVVRTLAVFANRVSHTWVRWMSDNEGVVHIIND